MNCQPKSISTIPTLLGVMTLISLMSFAADRLPKGWIKAGSHPQNYEIALDAAVKHGDKAAAYKKAKESPPLPAVVCHG